MVAGTPSPSTASAASPCLARRHKGANARVSRFSAARSRTRATALAAPFERSAPSAYRSSAPSSPGAASSQRSSAQRIASRGGSCPAPAKARIAVSTSMPVLRLAGGEPSGLAPLPELLDPVLLVAEHLGRQRHRRRHPDVGQEHERHVAPVRRDE